LTCQDERGQVLCHTPACPLAQAFALAQAAPYREVFWRAAGNKNKEVSASFAPVPAPGGPRGVIIARDISPLNSANRMRANFISMVSHDLRTPLNSINGFLEIVLDGMVGTLNPKQEEFLAFALTSTRQLMTLVEDVLFISRADSGQFKLRLDTMSILDTIAQCVRNLQAQAQKAQVNLRVALPDDLPTLYADELRLQQVLTNLINNAIKFTPPQGTITIEAGVDRTALRISVRDTGEGVPVEQQARIFERFVQLDADSQGAAGGYGLGLAIARLIVQQHGGRIWVRNAPEGGAIFTFTIPLSLRPAPAEEHEDA
jgi:two-component system phosphate regulon sensor histidine kinase PhoR